MIMENIKGWFESLYFSEPDYLLLFNLLYVLFGALAVIIILKFIYRPTKSKFSRYLLFGKDTVWVAVLAICALSIMALAGPQISKGVKLTPGGNIDVGFLVDYSFSTRTDDIGGKSRLEVTKTVIAKFVDSGELKAGDRITLFVFGTHSFWRMSLSEDFNLFRSKLAEISHPQVYWDDAQLRTNLAVLLELIPEDMDKQDNYFKKNAAVFGVSWFQNNRIMFLFSDGDDRIGADLDPGIKELNKRKIKVYPVGTGTREGKEITIEAYDPNDFNKTIKKTEKTSLKLQRLNEIASRTGGKTYVIDSVASISGAQSFLKNAVNSNRTLTPRLVASGESQDIWWEILAVPAIVLLLAIIKKVELLT